MLIACVSASQVTLRSFAATPTASCPRLVQPASSSTRPAATLLHLATANSHSRVVGVLISCRVQFDEIAKRGLTAVKLANSLSWVVTFILPP